MDLLNLQKFRPIIYLKIVQSLNLLADSKFYHLKFLKFAVVCNVIWHYNN